MVVLVDLVVALFQLLVAALEVVVEDLLRLRRGVLRSLLLCDGRLRQQPVNRVQQIHEALRVEHGHDLGMGLVVVAAHVAGDVRARSVVHKPGLVRIQQLQEALFHHLGVAGHTQNPGGVLQLVLKRGELLTLQDALEGLQQGAHLAGGHAQLVHRVELVGAHARLPGDDGVALLAQGIHHGRRRGVLFQIGLHMRRQGSGFNGIAQRGGKLRRRGRLARARRDQKAGALVDQRVALVGAGQRLSKLELPLAPAGALAAGQQRPGGDVVVAKLRDSTFFTRQGDLHAAVVHLRHRNQFLGAHDRAHLGQKFLGHGRRIVERHPHLVAAALLRQLQVPAVIRPAGAAAQRDLGTRQAQILRVVVHGGEVVLAHARDLLHAGQLRQVRHAGALVHGEFDLHLEELLGCLCSHNRCPPSMVSHPQA